MKTQRNNYKTLKQLEAKSSVMYARSATFVSVILDLCKIKLCTCILRIEYRLKYHDMILPNLFMIENSFMIKSYEWQVYQLKLI